jgi:hypothetical protein
VTAAGCYETPIVDPYPKNWLIDDFEGENPSAPRFQPWECRPQDAKHLIDDCRVTSDPNDGNNNVLHLKASLYPKEGNDDTFTRAEVATFTEWPQDVTSYTRLKLRTKLDWVPTPMPSLKVQLSCTGPLDSGVSPNPRVLMLLEVTGEDLGRWTHRDASLSPFDVFEKECLTRIDGIKITVDATGALSEDEEKPFDLYVDDVEFVMES